MLELRSYPPPEKWDDWVEYESTAWPRKVERRYTLVPTVCFNCEASCGLIAYIDKETGRIRKFEGNPYNPGSRGRNCAKGPATINQVDDPERILHPLKRAGPRGAGKWERTTWDEVLDTFGRAIRAALVEGRRHEVMYHVGRPGEDGYVERVLQAWGVDAHNSHTNVCSAGARLGYDLWMGYDRPSPDHANAKFILLLSSHLETGHYFNPHAQRIIEAQQKGAKIAAVDTRLSNTASKADYWLPTYPGTEAAMLLAMANVILQRDLFDAAFMRRWLNWNEYLRWEHAGVPRTFEEFIRTLKELYAPYTPEFAERETGCPASRVEQVALEIAAAKDRFASHVWRNASAGNLGGWQVARALFLLNVLTGSVGTEGGTLPNAWNKFVPVPPLKPPPQKVWSELLWPKEYPFAHHEMSILLPYLLKEGRGRLAAYFTRVYNPVWTNPDGFSWIEVLKDESKIGLHACLTPVWSETAQFADYVLPMGLGPERHDTMSFETHAGRWLTFRQPVLRVARERAGEMVEFTHQANPGEVWEEDEFWIELSWRIDPDGSLGLRQYFESPYEPGKKMTMESYYRWLFENSVPGLPEKAKAEGLAPLQYMKKFSAVEIDRAKYRLHETPVEADGAAIDPETGVVSKDGKAVGISLDGKTVAGFPTPSRRLEFYSRTLVEWGWPEHALPGYIKSHVNAEAMDREKGEFPLLPTFRLPTQIHTRSGNAKWLWELGNTNPLLMHPRDAKRLGLRTGELVRVVTETGYFVPRLVATEGILPGVVGSSHHFGRWRLSEELGTGRWASSLARLEDLGEGKYRLRYVHGPRPFETGDSDSKRVTWSEAGVHQNLAFPTHPDPLSGMHCWHQKVKVEKAHAEDRYGDVFADTSKSFEVVREWLKMTRPAPGPGNLRRPLWLARPFRPAPEAYRC
ncbi:MAG: molybdopterin-dependent oxidoreductase [Planctomycetes bacterium]|nr:molybdopterin-dependent oxidoreductase [Planctomycetota bacterium]